MGQENVLPPGTVLTLERYRARDETSEHAHCVFCFTKFMDPDFSAEHRRFVETHSEVLTEGYTTTAQHERAANHRWVCPTCVKDFADEFSWAVVES